MNLTGNEYTDEEVRLFYSGMIDPACMMQPRQQADPREGNDAI